MTDKIIKIFIRIQIALIICFGLLTVFKFEIWSPIDEGAHFNYIQYIAEKHRLPVLNKDYTSEEVLAIAEKIYPQKSKTDPSKIGLGGYSYEAFQPPLYYVLVSPIYLISGCNFYKRIFAIRLFNFFIYSLSLIILVNILKHRKIIKDEFFTFFLLCFAATPGIVIRSITISNAVLEIFISNIFFYFLSKTLKKLNSKNVVILAIIAGFGLLTRTTSIILTASLFFLLVISVLKRMITFKKFVLFCLISSLIIFCINIGWFLYNLKTYHSFTVSKIAMEMQRGIVNPNNTDIKLQDLLKITDSLLKSFVLPQEWGKHMITNTTVSWSVYIVINTFFLFLPVLSISNLIREKKLNYENLLLLISIFALIVNFMFIVYINVIMNWPTAIGRYLYVSFPFIAYIGLYAFKKNFYRYAYISTILFYALATNVLLVRFITIYYIPLNIFH